MGTEALCGTGNLAILVFLVELVIRLLALLACALFVTTVGSYGSGDGPKALWTTAL